MNTGLLRLPINKLHGMKNMVMRNLQEKIALILLISLISFRGFAQNEKYDAVYEQLTREYTLNSDGSMDFRFIKKQKLQTYRAFHNLYGETFVVYDTVRQQLKINEVFTTMADGKKIPAPGNAFNPALPGFAANAPAYNSLREMVITHTGLEREPRSTLIIKSIQTRELFLF